MADLRRHAHDARVLGADAGVPRVRAAADRRNGLLVSGLKDWIAGDTTTTAEATGTYGLYVIADQMAQMAAELGKPADAAELPRAGDRLANAFNAAFYDPARQKT